MAYTQTDLDNIEAAIKTGTLTVKHGDQQVTYRSLEEMYRIRSLIQNELNGTTDATCEDASTPRHLLADFSEFP